MENGILKDNFALRRFGDVRQLVASAANPTPLVRLNRVVVQEPCDLFLKLEWFNPFGSIKDRAALFMLKAIEGWGHLDGKQRVEPTSGNTGIVLAALVALMGRKFPVTIPDGVAEEKKVLLRILGGEGKPKL